MATVKSNDYHIHSRDAIEPAKIFNVKREKVSGFHKKKLSELKVASRMLPTRRNINGLRH